MPTITLRQLMEAGVCVEQLRAFREFFGDSAEKSMENALAAFRLFDWMSAADKFLDIEHKLDFDDKVEEVRHEFNLKRRALRAAYKAGGAAAAFDAAMEPLYDVRDRAYAVAFVDCYFDQQRSALPLAG
jgi:hypothetical protein